MSITEKELRDLIIVDADIEKISSVSSDGKNLLTRIPRQVAEKLDLKKSHKLRWLLNGEKISLEIIKKNAKEEN